MKTFSNVCFCNFSITIDQFDRNTALPDYVFNQHSDVFTVHTYCTISSPDTKCTCNIARYFGISVSWSLSVCL